MFIQCKLIRKGGTKISMDGDNYHFKENDAGDHVCDIPHEEHIRKFLNISEAYCVYGSEAQAEYEAQQAEDAAEQAKANAQELAEKAKSAQEKAKEKQSASKAKRQSIQRQRIEAGATAKRQAQAAEEAIEKKEADKAAQRAQNT